MSDADPTPHPDGSGGPVTQAEIRTLVFEFYDRVRRHPELGPVFEERLDGRWPAHLERMCEFWNTVLLGTRSYRGDPMRSHIRIQGIEPAHFDAWMDLFSATASEVMTPEAASDVVVRADRMRQALERVACDPPDGDPSRRAHGPSSLPMTPP